jgi:DNA processing protein
MATQVQAALALASLPGMTGAKLRKLWQFAGDFLSIQMLTTDEVPATLGELVKTARSLWPTLLKASQQRMAQYREQGITVLCLADEQYPILLREIPRPPPLLYVRGDSTLLSLPQVAIVGSRKATRGGLDQAHHFASALAASGFVVTSGMALGIDGAAHRGCLEHGKTIAVLGCGVDVVYPRRHQALYEEIVNGGGAVVSELAPGTGVRAEYFPQRNRIICGLSLGVLVVEAALRSGSLISARLAMEQGREVFAMPGSIHNVQARGCHQLIREGAVLTETLDDIIQQLGGMLSFKAEEAGFTNKPKVGVSAAEQTVLDKMGFEPVDLETLVAVTGFSVAELMATLVALEIKGYVESAGGLFNRRGS